MIGTTIAHYTLTGKLGEGGMGEVYRARDDKLSRDVALKILHDSLASNPRTWLRFQQEARAIAALDHPNIVTVYSIESHEVGGDRQLHFITMQLVEGETLAGRIRSGSFTLDEFFDLAIPLADALATAHDRCVIHRDLKPLNIMISSDGRPRILDFGLAKLRDEHLLDELSSLPPPHSEEGSTELTEDGWVVGTAHYMSPEQVQAQGSPLDGRSDIFSLGVVFHEMLTGEKPFTGKSLLAVMASILKDTPPRITDCNPGLPAPLAEIILRALEKDPDLRYQSAAELRNALTELREEIMTGESGPSDAVRSLSWRRGLVAVSLLVLAVIALGLAMLHLMNLDSNLVAARAVPLTSMEGDELDPALSPDVKQVAFVSNADSAASLDLYVKPLGSGEPFRLTDSSNDERHPAWSPDSQDIAFLRQAGSQHFEVHVISALGRTDRMLSSIPRVAFPSLDWSPDGRTLALVSKETAEEGEAVFVLEVATGAMRRLTRPPSGGEGDKLPRFSPDGRKIAFVHWFEAVRNEVCLVSADGLTVEKLAEHRGTIRGLDWLPDGSGLVASSRSEGSSGLWKISMDGAMSRQFFGEDATGVSVGKGKLVYSKQLSRSNIWRMGGPASEQPVSPQRFVVSTRDDWGPAYSPDGTAIALVSERTGKPQIWLCGSDGENCSQIVTDGAATMPRWAPDSNQLAFSQDQDGNSDVYVLDLKYGLTPRRLTESLAVDGPSGWSRDGRWIYYFSDQTNDFQVWKIDPEDPVPIQITQAGGLLAQESEDGYLYYLKLADPPGIWRLPIDLANGQSTESTSDPEELVMEDAGLGISGFALWQEYLVCALEREAGRIIFQSFNLKTGLSRPLPNLDSEVRLGKYGRLAISPDGRWIAYPQLEGLGSDLILVEDFQ